MNKDYSGESNEDSHFGDSNLNDVVSLLTVQNKLKVAEIDLLYSKKLMRYLEKTIMDKNCVIELLNSEVHNGHNTQAKCGVANRQTTTKGGRECVLRSNFERKTNSEIKTHAEADGNYRNDRYVDSSCRCSFFKCCKACMGLCRTSKPQRERYTN